MKSNGLLLVFMLAVGFGGAILPAARPALAAEVRGAVMLPPGQAKKRSFRGDLYRNRLAPDRGADRAPVERSPFADIVVSAHPLSFQAVVAPLPRPARMEQMQAEFAPRVLPVTVGTTVEFVNLDRFYHNVFSLTPGNQFDIGRRPTGQVVPSAFAGPGIVEIFCDIHPQMSARILVLDTPWFAQPDGEGRFHIDGLRPGRYRVRAFHPEHEAVERQVDVGEGVPVSQDFAFGR